MDIKSVIKTFAEAWAAASLKIEQNQANIPALNSNYSHWRTFSSLAGPSTVQSGKSGINLVELYLTDLKDLKEAETEREFRWRSDIKMVTSSRLWSVSVDSWIMMANGSLTLLSSEMLLSF